MPGVNWLLLCENNFRSITIPDLNTEGIAIITQDRVIDDNLKRQFKKSIFVYLHIIPTNLNFSICRQLVESILPFTHILCSIYIARV